jgi:RNA polymerase sigma factor (sigma-70 family)
MHPHPLARARLRPHLQARPQPDREPADGRPAGGDAAALAALTRAACAGDQQAWRTLFERFTPSLRAAARGFRLTAADTEDVVQATWLAAVAQIHKLHKPEAIGAWLLVTARREALRSLQRQLREHPTAEPPEPGTVDHTTPEETLLAGERRQTLHAAIDQLPHRQRRLLTTILTRPDTSYADLSSDLQIPIGSIGPTRRRSLTRLRRNPHLTHLHTDPAA